MPSLFKALVALCLLSGAGVAAAQQPATVTRTIKAVSYDVGGRTTTVGLIGGPILPGAKGSARVRAIKGVTNIHVSVKGLAQPTHFGAEFLTYVLWAVSPDGRTVNIGEMAPSAGGGGKLSTTTQLQTFSLFVTAEPYFAVRLPGELVVLENQVRKGTKGNVQEVEVKDYKLLKRTQYERLSNPLALAPDLKHVPLDVYQARNAVGIAKVAGADKYAADILGRAQSSLQVTEDFLATKAGKKKVVSSARQTVQAAEDARALSMQHQDEARIAAERVEAAARAKADAEAKAAGDATAARRRADEAARAQAELAATREQLLKTETDLVRTREAATKSEADRFRRTATAQRTQLLQQLARILETKDSSRGLVINMADVLFDVGKFDLRTSTREKLAKLSGVVLAYPGLKFDIEGHTDNTGSDAVNLELSRRRAEAVRSYLAEQGLSATNITARGFGKNGPVAGNGTAADRQKNRRVENVVSGEIIGVTIPR